MMKRRRYPVTVTPSGLRRRTTRAPSVKFRCDRERTVEYKIITLDVWGNARDGYDVNDLYHTGRTVMLPEHPTRDAIIACLRDADEIRLAGIQRKFFEVEGDSDYTLEIYYKRRPEFYLERVR